MVFPVTKTCLQQALQGARLRVTRAFRCNLWEELLFLFWSRLSRCVSSSRTKHRWQFSIWCILRVFRSREGISKPFFLFKNQSCWSIIKSVFSNPQYSMRARGERSLSRVPVNQQIPFCGFVALASALGRFGDLNCPTGQVTHFLHQQSRQLLLSWGMFYKVMWLSGCNNKWGNAFWGFVGLVIFCYILLYFVVFGCSLFSV